MYTIIISIHGLLTIPAKADIIKSVEGTAVSGLTLKGILLYVKRSRHLAEWRFLLFTIIVTVNRPICNVIRMSSPPFGVN